MAPVLFLALSGRATGPSKPTSDSSTMSIHRDLAKPPLTLPLYVPADGDDDLAASLDLREVCAASSAELEPLLAKPPNVFWSYVLHCPAVMAFVDSYLRFAPRHLGLTDAAELEAEEAELKQRVLLVLLRLAQPAESAELLSDAQWAETVYNNWIFSAPSLLDACALYAFAAPEQCRTLVSSVLTSQPLYVDDLAEALGAAAEALAQVCGRPAAGAAKKLPVPSALDAAGVEEVAMLAQWLQAQRPPPPPPPHPAAATTPPPPPSPPVTRACRAGTGRHGRAARDAARGGGNRRRRPRPRVAAGRRHGLAAAAG